VRAVNLIPPEDRRGDHAPLRAGVASYAIVGVLAVALIGVVLVILTGNKISDSEAELAGLEARKAQADLAAADLAPYNEFATLEQARSETVSSLAQTRFDWERVLNELALVIPRTVTLETLTGTAGVGISVGDDAGAADPSITGPSLLIDGCAHGQTGTARFLAALRDIDGVTRVGMQSSELSEETTPAAAPEGTDSTVTSCQNGPGVARFQATVAFDAVPVPAAAVPPTSTPAAVPTDGSAPTTEASTSTTDESGIATVQGQEQDAVDSANKQVSDAKSGAAAVGVDGE
jgi:Tfp pilus assembly protein PilN